MSDDQLILDQMKRAAQADADYFSSGNKPERECWVVGYFLKALGISFQRSNLKPQEETSKIDVRYESAAFQIKEITDPNSRRHGLYKDALKSIKSARSLEEVRLYGPVGNTLDGRRTIDVLLESIEHHSASHRYVDAKSTIDLLFYITRPYTGLFQQEDFNRSHFSRFGWRSISFVNTKQAAVLCATANAPDFIKFAESQLIAIPSSQWLNPVTES